MNLHVLAILFTTKFVPLIYAIFGFGLLITVHEFGHFIFCKIFKIHTPTFSIGMGPTIFEKMLGKTNFRLALIPIGGYVEIAGMAEVGQGDQESATDSGSSSFQNKPYWQKMFVLTGGVMFNLLFSYIAFSTLFYVGMPIQEKVALLIKSGNEVNSLQVGDKLLEIDGINLNEAPKELSSALQKITKKLLKDKKKKIEVGILRDGKKRIVRVLATTDMTSLPGGLIGGARWEPKTLKVRYDSYPFFKAIQKGFHETNGWIGKVLSSLKGLFVRRNIRDFGGPIMIVTQSFKMAQRGLELLFVFLAIISINLAVVNILPIGALDGGQILFETIEVVIRRRIPEVVRLSINIASWVFLLGLILFLSYQDIVRIFVK